HHQDRFRAGHLTSRLQSGLVYGCDPTLRRPISRARSGGTPWRHRMNRPFSALLLTLLLAPAGLSAQGRPSPPPPSPPERTGWHTVRPGETLEGIAAQFLGSAERWTEIHRLNPDIRDPHWIAPGRRIRIPSVES